MEQPTFADLVYDAKKRQTRREIFLERMDGLIPWQKLEERFRFRAGDSLLRPRPRHGGPLSGPVPALGVNLLERELGN